MDGHRDAGVTARISAALAEKADGVLESVAAQCGASLLQVLRQLPAGSARIVPGDAFEAIWARLRPWGDVLMIVQTPDIVLECTGPLPAGSTAHGYFNIHGDSPIGGHIRASHCAAIAIVDRPFHGRRSCSVQFLNRDGNAMFKVFVRRNEARELAPDVLAMFERLFADG